MLERLDGFDEGLGIGSLSSWQAAEGPDLILKALQRGYLCYFDPSLYGFHREYDLDDPAGGMAKRGRVYGRGMGYVLRRHGFGVLNLIYWASRPLGTAFICLISGRSHRMAYSLSVSLGRIEGWAAGVSTIGVRADTVNQNAGTTTAAIASKTSDGSHDTKSTARFGTKRREMTGPYRARNPLLVSALYTVDSIARFLPKRKKAIRADRPLRILVANWGHLGDVLTILPLLKFLEDHPRVEELGVLIGSWSRPILESSDIAAKIHVIDHWALNRSNQSTSRKIWRYVARYAALIDELRGCRYDMSIDTFASFPSPHGITWSASIPRRIGFTSGGLGPLLTDPFVWTPNNGFMLDQQLKLLRPLLGELSPESLPASYPGFEPAAPEHLLGVGKTPYVVIHMGPQNLRGWMPEKWASLAADLKGQGYEVVATGGPGEEMDAAHILSEKVSVRNLAGQLSWEEFVATVANATAIVTINSVAGHIAACFGVPTVVLTAGRQRLTLWRPNNASAIALTHPVGCAPCNRSRGCAAMACVRLLDVGEVLSSLQRVMNSRSAIPPQSASR